MGKGEKTSKDESDEDTPSTEETTDEETKPEKDEEEKPKPSNEPEKKDEENDEESEDTEKDKDDLRKVIKLKSTEEGEKKDEASNQKEPVESGAEPITREGLEQKRVILQSIKDFDFLIKKNQEGIGEINQKLESVTKDLDDLVSLYEIVSEQMNPFVGLSNVTKKRIDALENFTKEIEDLKERTGELESFAERSGAKLKNIGEGDGAHVKTIDIDAILGDKSSGEENENTEDAESSGELSEEDIQQPTPVTTINNNILGGLSDDDLDIILERAMGSFSPEGRIDMVIDEFIENLKG